MDTFVIQRDANKLQGILQFSQLMYRVIRKSFHFSSPEHVSIVRVLGKFDYQSEKYSGRVTCGR